MMNLQQVSHRIWLKIIVYLLAYQKNAFLCPFFNLRSKEAFIWTRAIRPVIAQSVQFSRIAKRLSIDLYQFFRIERKHCSY